MTGTSGKPLAAKLGVTDDLEGIALAVPRDVLDTVRAQCPAARIDYQPLAGVYHLRPSSFLWCFCSLTSELHRALPALRRVLREDGCLWISWPKKSAWASEGIRPELGITEEAVRRQAKSLGLTDVAGCAVDGTWSAMKLVVRNTARA